MESEKKILMTVDAGNSVKTIADLKREVNELKKALDQEVVGSDAAKQASDELADAQNQLKQAIQGSTDVMNIAKGSYYDLQRQCTKLKTAYKSMAGGIEKQRIGERIAEIQKELKKQDETLGDFQRNVGDYANAFGSALSLMGSKGGAAFTNLSRTGKGFKGVLDLLKAHPIIAVIGGVIAALTSLISLIKKNQEAVERIRVALSPFVGLFKHLQSLANKFTSALTNGLVKAANAVADLTEKIFGVFGAQEVIDKMRNAKSIEEDRLRIDRQRFDVLEWQYEVNKKIAELQSQYVDNYHDIEETAKIALQIENERMKAAITQWQAAKNAYDAAVKRAELEGKTKENMEAVATAYKDMLAAQDALVDSTKEWKDVLGKVNLETKKNLLLQRKGHIENLMAYTQQNINDKQSLLESARDRGRFDEVKYYKQVIEDLEHELKGYKIILNDIEDQIKAVGDELDKITEKARQELIKEVKEKSKTLEQYVLAYFDFDEKRIEDLTIPKLQKIINEWNRVILEDAKHLGETLINSMIKEGRGKGVKKIEVPLTIDISDEELSKADQKMLEVADRLRKRVEGVAEAYGYAYEQAQLNEVELYKQRLHDLELAEQTHLINHEEFLKAKQHLDEEYANWEKENFRTQIDAYAQIADNFASILGSIADSIEQSSEEEFEAAKAFNIASTTISTIAGAIGAYMGAVSNTGINSIPYVGPAIAMALGVTNAAAVVAAGIANIAKISQQKFGGNSSATASFGSASDSGINSINAPLQFSTLVEGASLDDKLESQKVYVTEHDLTTVHNRVNVQETENKY